jgi:hypothetical protein
VARADENAAAAYTTTIDTCAKQGAQNTAAASTWLERMWLRGVWPNYHTYNTALAACLDGASSAPTSAPKISTDMLEDAETEIPCGLKGSYDFCSTLPDLYTKVLARQLMKQLRENWRSTRVISSGYHATSRADRRAATNAKG